MIDQTLEDGTWQPKKQRHTAARWIYDRLKEEHVFMGSYTIAKDYVREDRLRHREVFVSLAHPMGDARTDFGGALGVVGGVERKGHFLRVDLPDSDDSFVEVCPAENTESFCEGAQPCVRRLGRGVFLAAAGLQFIDRALDELAEGEHLVELALVLGQQRYKDQTQTAGAVRASDQRRSSFCMLYAITTSRDQDVFSSK